ncbi:hypothetical protein [Altericista sp. CCNU0014]|uniref:hypothetical protein n=1 Tax=Altericista sp. CCNU0014 TaxID=3082949 RepID=UPI00384B9FED
MKVRFNRVPLYLTLALVPLAVVGCGESKDLSVSPAPAPVPSQPFPSPSVPATLNSPSKIALTRPTNPDDRLRVIKSGRPDPFGSVGPVARLAPTGGGGNNTAATTPGGPSTQSASSAQSSAKGRSGTAKQIAIGPGTQATSAKPSDSLKLPELPKAPEPAQVKVTGVVIVSGLPRAIVQAPDEPTSRTVGIGDSLSGGRLFVKSIDTSNRSEPSVVFQQGSIQFSVAVGREPVLLASASGPNPPVRGLYSLRNR